MPQPGQRVHGFPLLSVLFFSLLAPIPVRAYRTSPEHAQSADVFSLAHAADSALRSRDYDRAIRILEQILVVDPEFEAAHLSIAEALLESGREPEAVDYLRTQLDRNPFLAHGHSALGEALWRSGDAEGAFAAFRAQLEIAPLDPWGNRRLGVHLHAHGELEEVAVYLERAARITPEDPTVHLDLGHLYIALGRGPDAVEAFRAGQAVRPSETDAAAAAMWLADAGLELEVALDLANGSLLRFAEGTLETSFGGYPVVRAEDLWTLVRLWTAVGTVHERLGNESQAEMFLRAAFEEVRSNREAERLAEFYERAGRRDEAVTTYAEWLSPEGPPPSPGAVRVHDEIRARLIQLVGSESRADSLVEATDRETASVRFPIPNPESLSGYAVLTYLIDATGSPHSIEFDRGDEDVAPLVETLRRLRLPARYPPAPMLLFERRATLFCQPPWDTCTVNVMSVQASQGVP